MGRWWGWWQDDNPGVLMLSEEGYRGTFFLFGHEADEAVPILQRIRDKEVWSNGPSGQLFYVHPPCLHSLSDLCL